MIFIIKSRESSHALTIANISDQLQCVSENQLSSSFWIHGLWSRLQLQIALECLLLPQSRLWCMVNINH